MSECSLYIIIKMRDVTCLTAFHMLLLERDMIYA